MHYIQVLDAKGEKNLGFGYVAHYTNSKGELFTNVTISDYEGKYLEPNWYTILQTSEDMLCVVVRSIQ